MRAGDYIYIFFHSYGEKYSAKEGRSGNAGLIEVYTGFEIDHGIKLIKSILMYF